MHPSFNRKHATQTKLLLFYVGYTWKTAFWTILCLSLGFHLIELPLNPIISKSLQSMTTGNWEHYLKRCHVGHHLGHGHMYTCKKTYPSYSMHYAQSQCTNLLKSHDSQDQDEKIIFSSCSQSPLWCPVFNLPGAWNPKKNFNTIILLKWL